MWNTYVEGAVAVAVLWSRFVSSVGVFCAVFRYGEMAQAVGETENGRMCVGFLLGIERKALLDGANGNILVVVV